MQDTWDQPLGWEDPLEEGVAAHSVFLPGESLGQRRLVGYIVHGLANSQIQMKQLSTLFCFLIT